MSLSKSEEQVMEIIWNLEKAFMKEIMDQFEPPLPSNSTVLTLLKRMQEKGFVGYKMLGNSRQYYPLIDKEAYFGKQVNSMIKDFFGNSPLQFASFFTKSSDLNEEQLQELKRMIDSEIEKKKS
ncbi:MULTISPECIES: BlaI/MecI/CopY family transcriptional regulator [Sphingobacterium]|uniref:BlaI/MecI/CopY family transcriptional regulator n=1 Tax=Sphingobacterium tenebrionis TaxID=3111775 RepID=A0ABU8I4K4_9SPHI|nr:BlaI/MecI/CopY family transcriptional regulator [Sphingobacterium sp. CZ-2]QBR11330.1 BlaI/MecI/CopY family transcriptional regulator [Sphingobacterium sp. CZ-2]QBR11333.1 BlaI/MecI/CopY family transcriptional regulator [Sphingobacterium sp. CZ-2]